MNEIWTNRLIAGTKAWTDVPEIRRAGAITSEQYKTITGDEGIGK